MGDRRHEMELLMRVLMAGLLACLALAAQETGKRTWVIRIEPARAGFTPETMTESERTAGGAHFEYLKKALSDGRITFAGRTDDLKNLWGIIVTAAMTESEARTLMQNDPGVIARLFRGDVLPFLVVLKAP
jgi:hypothetical protein